jgi:predicted aspartyl protease
MKLYTRNIILLFFIINYGFGQAQDSFYFEKNKSDKIDFELIGNLIIIPLEINNVSLSFVLDTGVSKPILFNIKETDTIGLKNIETFFLYGLGGNGKLEALKSTGNAFRFGDITLFNRDLFVVYDEDINFTPRLGVLVHGIIGYDIFKNFIVEINYTSKFIRLHKPDTFKPKRSRRWVTLPLEINNKKPYLDAKVVLSDMGKKVKLLLDTGSSDAVWLFEDKEKGISPEKELVFRDYLGKGLSGSVYGQRSKLKRFKIGEFELERVNVAFPDSASVDKTKIVKERSGSLGGDILKRFNCFIDYTNSKIHLKRNRYFKEPFTYNNSGIVLEHNGIMFVKEEINIPVKAYGRSSEGAISINQYVNYMTTVKPAYEIVEVRKSSNAYAVGLRKGDVLISVNGKKAYEYKLSDINELLHGRTGKTIKILVDRYGLKKSFKFELDNVFTKKEPSVN